jgi:hypothetical protein
MINQQEATCLIETKDKKIIKASGSELLMLFDGYWTDWNNKDEYEEEQ